MQECDLGIIGGGPAGYTAAIHGALSGQSVVMFEKDCVGGTCLNRGCIPTKAIMHISEVYEEMKNSAKYGISAENVGLDYKKVIEKKDEIVSKLRKSLELTLKNSGVSTVIGEAVLQDKDEILCNGEIYKCKKVIVATGAKPRQIKGLEFDHKFILSSDDILNLTELPKSILIVGSGAIGIEWARIFSNFGVEVSVVEMAEHLVPLADIEVSKRVERIFKTKKIKFYLNNCIEKITDKKAVLKSGETLEPECILVAVGREAVSEFEINCECVLGDACGKIQLAHFASKQALEEVSGVKFDKNLVPCVIYGTPEIAWVGKREQDLEEGTYKKSSLLISALGKAHCDDCTEGFIKILSQDDKIVGAHIVSKEASSLVQQVLIAMQNEISIEKLKEVCFAHPTYSEGIFESLFRLS